MLRLIAAVLSLALPATAAPPMGPALPIPSEPATAEENKVTALKSTNTAGLFVPFLVALPLGASGISIAASAPIARDAGDLNTGLAFRLSGLSLMGAGMAAGVTINGVNRAVRTGMGGKWTDNLGFFVAGTAASAAGIGLAAAGTQPGIFPTEATSAALLIPGGLSWGAGMILLIADAFTTARENLAYFAAAPDRAGPRFAGLSVTPTDGGAALSVGLVW